MSVELQPLALESTLTMQKVLEANDHTERLLLVRNFMEAETKRLGTKRALQGMFSGKTTLSDASIPAEEQLSEEEEEEEESEAAKPSNFFNDEPDAFQ